MTLLLPKISYFTFKTFATMFNIADYAFRYQEHVFPNEFLCWIGCIFIPIITTTLSGYCFLIHGIFSIPIYFWNLLWHPNGRLIYEMLQNPEGNGHLISCNKQNHRYCWRERARPVPRWVWRRKPCQLKYHWSTLHPKDKTIV
jgi:hypothetical protein